MIKLFRIVLMVLLLIVIIVVTIIPKLISWLLYFEWDIDEDYFEACISVTRSIVKSFD